MERARPRIRQRSAACAFVAVAMLLASAHASAFEQNTNVVILMDRSSYRVGDTVNLTILVFSYAAPTDPGSLTVKVYAAGNVTRSLNVTRQAVGVYNASYRVASSDVGPSDLYAPSLLPVQARAVVGPVTDAEIAFLVIAPSHAVDLAMIPSSYSAGPGRTVSLSLRATVDGVPRDARWVNVTAFLSTSAGAVPPSYLAVVNASTGNYTAAYVVPGVVAPPAVVSIVGVANVAGVNVTRSAVVYVPGPTPFDIWSYQTAYAPPVAAFQLFVANASGQFVPGANVSLNYSYASASVGNQFVTKPAAGVTDAVGRAAFTLDLGNATDVLYVAYRGNVTARGDRQGFSGLLYAPLAGLPPPFQILRTNPFDLLVVNTTAQLNYTVQASGSLLAGIRVYYYVQTDRALLAAGNTTSDGQGRIVLSVPVGTEAVRTLLTARTGSTWFGMSESLIPVRPLSVRTGAIRVGTAVRVTVALPGPGTWYVSVSLAPSVLPTAFTPWLSVSGFVGPGAATQSGSNITYSLPLSRFLPKDADYLLSATAYPVSLVESGRGAGVYGYSRTIYITNVPAQVRGTLSTDAPVAGQDVDVDGSGSFDTDGYVAGYRIAWGDGIETDWAPSPVLHHAYASAGDFRITFSVRDDTGAVSATQFTVHVESTFLGLRTSLAIVLFTALAATVGAVAYAAWRWRRRRPPVVADAPSEPADAGP